MNTYRLIFVVLLFSCVVSEDDERKPIYNIAHMVNSIAEVDQYLNAGANAIETDIYFDSNGNATHTFHGYPCDCFRICDLSEKVEKFLKYIDDITTEGKCCLKF
ncbi:Sphingomyelin phosphodiesterase D SpeSicTox-betaIB2a-like protein [Leptotrombidium deliense]|uniref:Sphingomyelin phosphodiesterase D SpeSicTox-betaIB2a-like protein n=1 Tax=Leptotrombidium deliense TaxID=299467 RepID=A0A443SC35_9ACAR|nr:Sphingomyelin phosphodiesterase D SpeSicTox-betaIB2a-like protein [Leptotrombidium deliense]